MSCPGFGARSSPANFYQSEIGNRKSEIFLNSDFQNAWRGKDPFAEAFRLDGEVFRSVKSRRTFRFELNGKSYFAKVHRGAGWKEIFKNLFQFKKPVLSARNEYDAIRRLEKLGVATMTVAAFGERGKNPAKIESFIITEELKNTISLEDFCRDWKENPSPFALKKALIEYIAAVSRTLHRNGVNHRDYYICHFLFDKKRDWQKEGVLAYLIDLHRTQLRKKTPRRWIIKDLAGLYFSTMDIGLTERDLFRFLKIYSGCSLENALNTQSSFFYSVQWTALKLYRKEQICPKG
ncbi:MAG: lipopolysaccharide core heptose(I) kinase RfaP [Kiritimatiellales bacterium]